MTATGADRPTTAAIPPRRPRSVRRTTTLDSTRPDGLGGPVVVAARGRDLRTDSNGHAVTLAAVGFDATVDFSSGTVLAVDTDPADPALEALAGAHLYTRFRRAVEDALPGEAASQSVRHQLLDDLTAAVMASGRVLRVEGIPIDIGRGGPLPADICAGWVTGGTLMSGLTELGPPIVTGPVALAPGRSDDSLAWHDCDPLPPLATRRLRRIDVWEEHGVVKVDTWFRDSHVDARGVETVVHEWRVEAAVDRDTLRFVACDARDGPLPYPECPATAASAQRLRGAAVDGLRRSVRERFVGTTTCTHLNDTMRSLEAVSWLLAALRDTDGTGA